MTPRNFIIGAIFAALILRIAYVWWPREETPVDWERVSTGFRLMHDAADAYRKADEVAE